MQMDWSTLAIISMFAFGLMNFLYNVSARKGCNNKITSLFMLLTAMTLSYVIVLSGPKGFHSENFGFLFLLAAMNSLAFFTTTLARMEALHHGLPAIIVFPVLRSAIVIVGLYSFFWLHEIPNIPQWLGMFLGVAVIIIAAIPEERGEDEQDRKPGYKATVLVLLAMLTSATSTIILTKVKAPSIRIFEFISISYTFALTINLLALAKQPLKFNKTEVSLGIGAGICNVTAIYVLIRAFSVGPKSLVACTYSLYFVVTIFLSFFIFRTPLTKKRVAILSMAIASLLLMRLG